MATQTSSESKAELNGENTTEQGIEVLNTKLLVTKQSEHKSTEDKGQNEDSVITNDGQVVKTNGTVKETEPCLADNSSEKLKSEEKSDVHPIENGTENNNIEFDVSNKDIDSSKVDTDLPKTSSEAETCKETVSNGLKETEELKSEIVADVKSSPKESIHSHISEPSEKSQTQEIKTVSDNKSGGSTQFLSAVDLVPDSSEPAKLDKIDSEIATSRTVTDNANTNVPESDKDNDLECPHLEPECPMEVDAPTQVKEIESLDTASDKSTAKDGNLNISEKDRSEKSESDLVVDKNMEVELSNNKMANSEKVIVYHEDTLRIVGNSETNKQTCDKEQKSELNNIAKESENVSKDTSSINSTSVVEAKKPPETVSSKPKGQKLDELLSKIATKATNDLNIPKKAKARKSCAQASPSVEKAVVSSMSKTPASIANLTFNVKMLEKQGVLDIPKPQNKRKAFEPFKLKVKDSLEKTPAKVAVVKSPVKSPKKDSPFFNTNKVIKGRRRKKKKMGSYKLPSEKKQKTAKDRKKASEERQLSGDEKSDKSRNSIADSKMEVEVGTENVNNSAKVSHAEASVGQQRTCSLSQMSAKNVDIKTETKQQTLDDMIKKSKLFTNSVTEKPKEPVKPGMDQTGSHSKSLDAFLKRVSQLAATSSKNVSLVTETHVATQSSESQESLTSGLRKRKATAEAVNVPTSITPDKSVECQDEKKRKTEIPVGKSPPPPVMILPGKTSPFSVGRPVVPVPSPVSIATPTPVSFTQLTSPNSKQPPKAIIQNGTLNGMPVFQIISNGNLTPGQIVAIGNQGQSLLPSSLPKTAILQSPPRLPGAGPGVPVILTPVAMPNAGAGASGVLTQTQNQVSLLAQSPGGVMNIPNRSIVSPVNTANQGPIQMKSIIQPIAAPIPLSVFNQSIVASTPVQVSGQLPVLNQLSKSPLEHNLLKPSHIPNGLYPVTPPKTPDDQAGSDTGSQESAEVSPGQQISPEKDIIPLCTCKLSGASFPKLVASVTFCQALDSVDNKAMGCCNKVTNSQLVRPAVKIPFMAVCEHHRKRLKLHQCCPGCGHFCTQGKFLQCRNEGNQIVHNFHEECQVIKDGKNYCPHCGEASAQVTVQLMLQEKRSQTLDGGKSSRIQIKAKMAIADKIGVGSGDESAEETTVVLEKTKKVLSTADVPIGPDKHSLERVLSSLSQERPKKYRHLPKCLYTPAYDNDLDRVVYMLEDGHDANEKYDDLEGQGAIHAAAAVGSLPIVHVLIQAGASPHLQDKNLRTPLSFAAENNHQHVVKYLLKVGSVIDSKADDGMTSLHYAAKAGHVGIIKVLLDVEGLNIDVKDDGGYTPLIWAAEHEQLEVVKYLLKRNADPNLRDSEENTALHWAAFSGSVNVSEVLLNAGCELDSLNMHGDRPLHIASRQDHYECVVLFLARGADVNLENNKGETPAKCCIDENSPTHLALKVNKQLKSFGAKHMGRPEKLLTRDISKGRENIPIPCVNSIDDDGIPTDYLYVTDNVETTCLNVNRVIGSLQSCQCKDDCSSIYCACGKSSVRCWYDKYGRLVPEFNMLEPSLIFECNRACECWTTCNNRVVQNGVMSRLQVFKTEGRGWGCKTLVPIPRGTFICEYIGEHISDHEADRREDDSYLFDLDNKDGETYCIDARKFGNIARFINHLCEPNLVPVKVFVDSQDLRFPRICLFASRDILAQEELGFDYGEKFWIIKWKHFTCTCGSPKCRYSKDTIHKTIEEYRARHEEDLEAVQE